MLWRDLLLQGRNKTWDRNRVCRQSEGIDSHRIQSAHEGVGRGERRMSLGGWRSTVACAPKSQQWKSEEVT
jgi:hypothetical protein